MALYGVYCSSCGLEILSDHKAVKMPGSNDWYHTPPYNCYIYRENR